ncbi:hypothetical protein FSP39_015704 [Pinctada imbricata]|uniref:Aminotransferase class I/classII large domain-containing protein n=1 Tax=Pinctada imbricata TaxID=66713 RepID=A0AA88XLA5_PINIB|nr:hypothetical protein FSP39_015704 [Pinctada imbricata]
MFIFRLCYHSISQGKIVRGVVISNPDNPTGRVYTKAEIMDVLEMCAKHQLHVVMDEIYALSVFGDVVFESVLSFPDIPDPKRTHFLWSVSKVGFSLVLVDIIN